MAERFLHLIAIILATGLIGGTAAWLSEPRPGLVEDERSAESP